MRHAHCIRRTQSVPCAMCQLCLRVISTLSTPQTVGRSIRSRVATGKTAVSNFYLRTILHSTQRNLTHLYWQVTRK